MVQICNPEINMMSKEILHPYQGTQTRKTDIVLKTAALIDIAMQGNSSRLQELIAEIAPSGKSELGMMAQIIVSKALEEPQHSQACVNLSDALRETLPTVPNQRSKAENFMHAILDVFQTEFEDYFAASTNRGYALSSPSPMKNQIRLRAILNFAGHLYRRGLLGNRVVKQMVEDLLCNGEEESANELLWSIGVVGNSSKQNSKLGTIVEDA